MEASAAAAGKLDKGSNSELAQNFPSLFLRLFCFWKPSRDYLLNNYFKTIKLKKKLKSS